LKKQPSGRNEGFIAVVVDKCSKLSLCNDSEDGKEQGEDHLVANDEPNKIST
jgi:hypothetical protein